jgi:DNA polymerase-3 subunit gamma/tau
MSENTSPENSNEEQYQVVALKYRPQGFDSLIGQGHIAQALSNAIDTNRVGHAYLFTGARGVGKTSSARIFAKCLNCSNGPTPSPCNECDICQSVSIGEDVDVLEIDGASNRGIDEIRLLRQNASIRPSRGRYKIYIIDEVHMLTTQAFNALLKTLEEPPQHVKFIFCTTDPQKIPITVLSRCQRFDFSPVQADEISKSLKAIAEKEGVTASDEALALLARRANGSMRDSQSLLEQLFSFCGSDISVDEVHELLGTTDMGRIAEIAGAIAIKDTTQTLSLIHESVTGGVDAGQLTGQLLGYFRDMMAVRAGCGEDILLNCSASDMPRLQELADELGLQTILTIVQMIDSAVVRMQSSLHKRTLLEVAAIRACNLESIDAISDLVNSLSGAGGAQTSVKRSSPGVSKSAATKPASKPKTAVKKNEVSKPSVEKTKVFTDSADFPSRTASKSGIDVAVASGGAAVAVAAAVGTGAMVSTPAVSAPQPVDAKPMGDSTPNGSTKVAEEPTAKTYSSDVSTEKRATSPNIVAESVSTTHSESNSTAANSPLTTVSSSELKTLYDKALEGMGDMTADMAANYAELAWSSDDCIEVALCDVYHKNFCSKTDRKSKIESAFETVSGRKIRIDFTVSQQAVAKSVQDRKPQLSRVQQIRELQEVDFVKEAVALFDGEIAGFFNPNKRA